MMRKFFIDLLRFQQINAGEFGNLLVLKNFCRKQPKRRLNQPFSLIVGNLLRITPSKFICQIPYGAFEQFRDFLSDLSFHQGHQTNVNEFKLPRSRIKTPPNFRAVNGVWIECCFVFLKEPSELTWISGIERLRSSLLLSPALPARAKYDKHNRRATRFDRTNRLKIVAN